MFDRSAMELMSIMSAGSPWSNQQALKSPFASRKTHFFCRAASSQLWNEECERDPETKNLPSDGTKPIRKEVRRKGVQIQIADVCLLGLQFEIKSSP